MRRDFSDRNDLISYVHEQFPAAAAVDDHISDTRGGRRAAEAALRRINPVDYASTRNYLDGTITRLSPYLRHGVLSLSEVRAAALAKVRTVQQAGKLINELACRDYFQRVYNTIGHDVWTDLEAYKTGYQAESYAEALPEDIARGSTGLACMDAFSRELRETGYLHNHARMWLASYIVHWRRVRWQTGARWFLTHLLDGDPASNNLSWQWVASTFSHKPYIFNRQNLERFTNDAYCTSCPLRNGCELDGEYDRLAQRLFPQLSHRDSTQAASSHSLGSSQPLHRLQEVEASSSLGTDGIAVDRSTLAQNKVVRVRNSVEKRRESTIVWIHGDNLHLNSPALRAFPNVPAIWVWDAELLKHQRISLKRIVFLYECLLELPVAIHYGDVQREVLRFAATHNAESIVTLNSPSPRFASIHSKIGQQMSITRFAAEPFVKYHGRLDLRRFSRYWRRVEKDAMAP